VLCEVVGSWSHFYAMYTKCTQKLLRIQSASKWYSYKVHATYWTHVTWVAPPSKIILNRAMAIAYTRWLGILRARSLPRLVRCDTVFAPACEVQHSVCYDLWGATQCLLVRCDTMFATVNKVWHSVSYLYVCMCFFLLSTLPFILIARWGLWFRNAHVRASTWVPGFSLPTCSTAFLFVLIAQAFM